MNRIRHLLRFAARLGTPGAGRRLEIRHGVTPSSVLMRKLASYPRQNQLAQALAEVGKVEQTLHLLDCYRDEAAH